jgi:nucleotide-binding universal stress UspA family protein
MAPRVIVSYDDTAEDRDALALARLFASAGASLALAYIRHTQESEQAQERLEEHDAEALLARGAQELGEDVPRHVIVSASTGEGLQTLAERERADIVVFGSDYRTAPGRVLPGTSAQRLLAGGPVAVALAPASLRDRERLAVATVGVIPQAGDPTAEQTARGLAANLSATLASSADEAVDLLVVGSRPEAPEGRVMISAAAEYAIETASSPVLVVPRGVALSFPSLSSAAV